ncbi:hypothetical protein ES707_22696 [subsurface metagenome]
MTSISKTRIRWRCFKMKHWHEENGVWLYGEKKITCTKAAHEFCINFCLSTAQEATKCLNIRCPLWGFRKGNSPNRRKGHPTSKQTRNGASGEFLPVNSGEKLVNIKAYSKEGKLRIILPSGDELTVSKKEKR